MSSATLGWRSTNASFSLFSFGWGRTQGRPQPERGSRAEHPYVTIKHHWDQDHFMTCTLPSARAEMVLTILAYNINRAIMILGVRRRIEAPA